MHGRKRNRGVAGAAWGAGTPPLLQTQLMSVSRVLTGSVCRVGSVLQMMLEVSLCGSEGGRPSPFADRMPASWILKSFHKCYVIDAILLHGAMFLQASHARNKRKDGVSLGGNVAMYVCRVRMGSVFCWQADVSSEPARLKIIARGGGPPPPFADRMPDGFSSFANF